MESTGQSDRRPPRRETREDPGEKTPVRPREQPRLKVEPSVLWVLASLLAITALHYATPGTHHWVHHIARRLYYLPIIIAAFGYGIRGGLFVALVVSVVYVPHAFFMPHMADPAPSIEKALEMVLYFVVGGTAGHLADKAKRRREALAESLRRRRQLTRQLTRAERLSALGEVVAGISHEIKNPLHSLKGTAEIVDPVIPEDVEERRLWEIHRKELGRLEKTADRFLSFARPSPAEMTRFDLRDVRTHLLDLVGAEARQRGIELKAPEAETPLMVNGDRDDFTQFLLNIALNAFHALSESKDHPPRAKPPKVVVALEETPGEEGPLASVRIENNGPPIPDEDLERIFDPFHTTRGAPETGGELTSQHTDSGGTGLGLSISAKLAEQNRGFIKAKNLPTGVAFTLSVPLASQ